MHSLTLAGNAGNAVGASVVCLCAGEALSGGSISDEITGECSDSNKQHVSNKLNYETSFLTCALSNIGWKCRKCSGCECGLSVRW